MNRASFIPYNHNINHLLDYLVVRPIKSGERTEWDRLMSKHHYLGFKSLVGESIRYVAELNNIWCALLGWSSAALKCQPRDSWIGWSQAIQWQRLHLIANNSRFLILPNVHIPNLASKVLSLNLKQIRNDWQKIHGHPVLLAETFVDISRFSGTCYKAANWFYVGNTQGFGKSARRYYHHGQPKAVFVRPLHKLALRWLTEPLLNSKLIKEVGPMKFTTKQIEDLIHCLKGLPDPRHNRGKRHRQLSILAISICAVLCGARSFAAIAEWATYRTQNQLNRLWCRYDEKKELYVPPSEPTIRRLLQTIDAEIVDQAIYKWLATLCDSSAVAFDGKVLKGARNDDGTQVHLLSAVTHQEGITISQKQIASKSNEIPTARPLLEPLNLKGKVVTGDAMHTQRDLARFLVEKKHADYFFTVKDNQQTLREDIEAVDLNDGFPP